MLNKTPLGITASLPSRERGLKYEPRHCATVRRRVAPFKGAWIEIACPTSHRPATRSLPSRERGLKWTDRPEKRRRCQSLPSRERGLKCRSPNASVCRSRSLPSRERGLKYGGRQGFGGVQRSLPSRERGLKFLGKRPLHLVPLVAPLKGAWIEMPTASASVSLSTGRSLQGSVD